MSLESAKVPEQDWVKALTSVLLLQSARTELSRLKHLWVDAGYEGRAKRWAQEVLGLSVEVVCKPRKLLLEEVAKRWA